MVVISTLLREHIDLYYGSPTYHCRLQLCSTKLSRSDQQRKVVRPTSDDHRPVVPLESMHWLLPSSRGNKVSSYTTRGGTCTNYGPSDDAAFDNHLRLGSKVLWLPDDKIGQTTCRNLSYKMRHAVTDRPLRNEEQG